MTINIYVARADKAILAAAKRAAKKHGDSVSRIAMEAIRKYAEKYYREVAVTKKDRKPRVPPLGMPESTGNRITTKPLRVTGPKAEDSKAGLNA